MDNEVKTNTLFIITLNSKPIIIVVPFNVSVYFLSCLCCLFCVFSDSNAGSVTHLVSNEQPLAVIPLLPKCEEMSVTQYSSQPSLNQTPVYSNIVNHSQELINKSHSFTNNLSSEAAKRLKSTGSVSCNLEDLHLDPVVLRDAHILPSSAEKRRTSEHKLDNDLTLQDKENSLLSASRLRLLQDTTMIESALDLDSLDDSSIGTNSQAGLMKVVV